MNTNIKRLGDICIVRRGTTITQKEARDGNIPVVGGGVKPSYFHDQPNRKGNTITVSASGASAGFINFYIEPIFASDCSTVEPKDNSVDVRYIYRAMQNLQPYIYAKLKAGAAQPHVYAKDIAELEIPIPTLKEQQRIAGVLDTADRTIKLRESAIAKLDQLTHSVFEDMFGSTKDNPKKFATKKLKEIIKFEGGSQPPASTFSDSESDGFIRLVQIRDFRTDKYKTYIPKNLAKRFFNSDDVMIGRYGPPVFQIFRGLSGSYNVALMKANPSEFVTKDFVYYLLQENYLHSFVVANSERTAGQSGVNLDLLENYTAYLPPLELQKKFTLAISQYQDLKLNFMESHKNLRHLFSSLQHQSFSVN